MIPLSARVLAVLTEAWRLLPSIKRDAAIASIGVEDLGAKHGTYDPDTQVLMLSERLFWGDTPDQLVMIDVNGATPPLTMPFVSRALHTAIHEIVHAIGAATGLDQSPEWLRLSSWVQAGDDSEGTARYWERRPGWPQGPSPWRHRLGCWFAREYSQRSPHEDFADAVTHVALGWHDEVGIPNGVAKVRYLRRTVWGERGVEAVAAARERWRTRLFPPEAVPAPRIFCAQN